MGKMWRSSTRGRSLGLAMVVGLALVCLLATLPTMATAQTKSGQAKTLRIGYCVAMSGWYSVFDSVEDRYVRAMAKIINEKGGITVQGQKYNIELVGQDFKSTMDGVTAATTKLVFDDKVKFVIGPTAFFGPAATPVLEQNKIFHIAGYASCQPNEMDATTPYTFLPYNAIIGNTIACIKVMKKEYPNAKRVAIATPDDGAIPYLMPKTKRLLEAYGLTMAGTPVAFPNEMEDFSPIAAKLNAIKDYDAIMIVNGAPAAFGLIAKNLRSLGNDKPIIIPTIATCAELMAICGKSAANDIVTLGFTPHKKGNPALFDQLFDEGGKKMPIQLNCATGLWALTRVIQAANSLDPSVIKAKWESLDKIETPFGPGISSGEVTYGIKHHALGHPMQYEKLVKGEVVYGGWVDVGAIP